MQYPFPATGEAGLEQFLYVLVVGILIIDHFKLLAIAYLLQLGTSHIINIL